MKKFKQLIIITVFIYISMLNISHAMIEGQYIYNNDNTIDYSKTYKLYLDSSKSKEKKVELNFDNYNISPPTDCLNNNAICEETTEISINTKKHWKIIKIDNLTTDTLDAYSFAKYIPDIKSTDKIDNLSPLEDKLIAQKILYERGMLDSKPTGKIGWLTEKAIIKFQYLKNIDEFNEVKRIAYIGPKTIRELNNLKNRMRDPEYLKNNPLPNISENELPPKLKSRMNEINKQINNLSPKDSKLYNQQVPISETQITPLKPDYLKFEGQAEIKKHENK